MMQAQSFKDLLPAQLKNKIKAQKSRD